MYRNSVLNVKVVVVYRNGVLNVKAVVAAFNHEKALVGAFSVIVKTNCESDGSFYSTRLVCTHSE